jgi:hypothetical protein
MYRDDVAEQRANLDIAVGEQYKQPERFMKGAVETYAVFDARPNSERLLKTFDCAKALGDKEKLAKLAALLPPRNEPVPMKQR